MNTSSSEEQHRQKVFADMAKHEEIQDSVKNQTDGQETVVDIDIFKDMLNRRSI